MLFLLLCHNCSYNHLQMLIFWFFLKVFFHFFLTFNLFLFTIIIHLFLLLSIKSLSELLNNLQYFRLFLTSLSITHFWFYFLKFLFLILLEINLSVYPPKLFIIFLFWYSLFLLNLLRVLIPLIFSLSTVIFLGVNFVWLLCFPCL